MLGKKKMNLDICIYLVSDETDHLMDLGFTDAKRNVGQSFERLKTNSSLFSYYSNKD